MTCHRHMPPSHAVITCRRHMPSHAIVTGKLPHYLCSRALCNSACQHAFLDQVRSTVGSCLTHQDRSYWAAATPEGHHLKVIKNCSMDLHACRKRLDLHEGTTWAGAGCWGLPLMLRARSLTCIRPSWRLPSQGHARRASMMRALWM